MDIILYLTTMKVLNAMQCNAMQYNAITCHTMQSNAIQYHTAQHNLM